MPITTRNIIVSFLLISLLLPFFKAQAQEGVPIDVKKPPKFENKILKSEKTGEKKFTLPRRLTQNMASRYNFYFNAKNKYDAIIERATEAQRDDFTKLLPFYGYSLDNTANETTEIDSILLKCTAGILLHDLRNDWVDNLYLLIGKAYLLRKDFDSAQMTFQFINYNFHPSRKETDRVYIGSNVDGNQGGSVNVVTREKAGLLHKAFSLPPSRNDALLWQTRNFIEMNELVNASALLTLLKTDKNFPPRLIPFHEELQAYIFYKQEQWDSAANHFEKALDNASNRQDLARREYLLAQLYAKAHQNQKASRYFNKASSHTTNLLMAIHADLNEAQLVRGNEENDIKATISDLLHMARRDKYDAYRDLLYYSAAQLQLQINDTAGAVNSYFRSIDKTVPPAFEYLNKSYIHLSDIAFHQKQYRLAASLIDSVQLADESIQDQQEALEKRKVILHRIAANAAVIEKEDSLQRLAKLPEAELDAYLKKLVKKLRKEKGLKEEEPVSTNPAVINGSTSGTDLFGNNDDKSGDWYFYNAAVKARGFTEFKAKWGKRQNVDNWRRMSAVNASFNKATAIRDDAGTDTEKDNNRTGNDITVEALKENLPLTEEKLQLSNDTIAYSLFDLANVYKNSLEDYKTAAETYEELYRRFPNSTHTEETLFNLYYCWQKAGDEQKSAYYKSLLNKDFKTGKYISTIAAYEKGVTSTPSAITQRYEQIYDLMLAGKFKEAFDLKKKTADEYPGNKWTPQLLYIEAIYQIKQNNDSAAKEVLDNILTNFPTTALYEKAQTMLDVLDRRKEIEGYLTNLVVTRAKEEEVFVPEEVKKMAVAKNNASLEVKSKDKLIVQSSNKPAKVETPAKIEAKKDSIATKPAAEPVKVYTFNPQSVYLVMMILENVDGIYVGESRNAFNRYNSTYHNNDDIQVTGIKLNDSTALNIFTQFTDALKATDYALELKERTRQIVPWLKGGRYSYIIISPENLELLQTRKDVAEYRRFLAQYMPGKF